KRITPPSSSSSAGSNRPQSEPGRREITWSTESPPSSRFTPRSKRRSSIRRCALSLTPSRWSRREDKSMSRSRHSCPTCNRPATPRRRTEEERRMFPLAEQLGRERLAELGEQLHDRKQTLKKSVVSKINGASRRSSVRRREKAPPIDSGTVG